jgi:polyhydroxyalkanoate synthase
MATDKPADLQEGLAGQADLVNQAAEGILGPNPFIGLRPGDILASLQEIGQHAVQHPTLVIEQEAALVRDLISILSGQSDLAPVQGDKRFGDAIWKENPLYRICLQGYLAWTHALQDFVEKSSLDARTEVRSRPGHPPCCRSV